MSQHIKNNEPPKTPTRVAFLKQLLATDRPKQHEPDPKIVPIYKSKYQTTFLSILFTLNQPNNPSEVVA
ncbi:hypothetical protein Hanom_Chr13g01242251 [Helianthus anomalus]